MLRRPDRRLAGVSLAEMLIVVAILSVAAAVAIPHASSTTPQVVDAAAAEVARALRFAQREAIRTRSFQWVSIDPASQVLRVYKPTSSGGQTTLHPVDKRDYQISFGKDATSGATIVSAVFKYDKGATTNYISFTPDGSPGDMHQFLVTKDIDPLKEDGVITLRYGNAVRVVRVAPVTGRVSL